MDVVGISSEEQVTPSVEFSYTLQDYLIFLACLQDAIFRVVASILHLGNIEFGKGKEIDSSVPRDDKSWFHLKTAAELLM